MKPAKETSAVKLPFETGEYLITWQVPDRRGGHLAIPGLLTVEQGKYPTGILYGDLPIEWVSEGATGVASFPQRHAFDVLTGRLSSGAYVALMNGELSYSFPGNGRAVGAFAALSLDAFDTAEHRKYASIELQIEGLESVAGVAPISRVKMPMKAGDEPVWEATVDKDAKFTWSVGGQSMTFSYDYSVRALDGYEFRMAFGPVLRLNSDEPLTVVDWWLEWVRPFRQLISLLTGAPRELRYLLTLVDEAAPRSHRDQVFGWDITHLPVNSTRAAVEEIRSAVNLANDGLSLLDLLHAWQRQITARHPLFETYGAMATATDQHPRSRFLLLLQALEGSYGFENRAKHEANKEKYGLKREGILARAQQLLEKADFTFINKNLRREAQQGLDSALADLLKRLPDEVSEELTKTELIKAVRKEDTGKGTLPLQTALTRARNTLSHRLDQQRHSRILQNVFVRVKKYSSRTILTLLVGIGLLATLAPAPIAFAAPTDHSNEQSCVDAGYRWQGGTCVDPDAEEEEEEEAGSSCAIEGMGWIICPAMNFLADSTDAAFGFLSDYFLQTDVSYINGNGTDRPVYNAWAAMRTVANVAFVIAFMIIIYSQMTSMGISNYGVKKMLPRLVIAAILVNLSFFICQLAIDISNILGSTLNDFFRSLGTYIETGESFDPSVGDQVAQGIGAGLLITGALAAGVGILLAASMPVILAALLALLLILLILFARIALIILLVIISPLAFVAFLLPNTEQWFKKWYKMFAALLMVYPIISVVFGASSLAANVIYTSATSGDDTNWMLQIVALGVATIPLFLVPSLLKNSMSAAGSIGGKLAGMSSKATGRVGAKVRDTSRLGEAQRGLKNKFALSRASRRGKVTTAIGKTRAGKALGLENGIDNSRFGRALGLDKGAAAAIAMVNKAEDEAVDQAIIRMRAGSDPREMISAAAQHLETANKNGDVVSARAAQKILLNSGSKGVAKLHDTLHGIEASGNLNEGVSRELRNTIRQFYSSINSLYYISIDFFKF